GALVVRAAWIAFDVHDPVALDLHQRRAADGAEGADAGDRLRVSDAQLLGLRACRGECGAESYQATDGGAGTRTSGDFQEVATADLHCLYPPPSDYQGEVYTAGRASFHAHHWYAPRQDRCWTAEMASLYPGTSILKPWGSNMKERMAKSIDDQELTEVSEAQIAVHWKEEEYYQPSEKFKAQ